jgi:hypothetical protein
MKNLFALIAFIAISAFSPPEISAQRNVDKTVEVLNLPTELAAFDGIVYEITSATIVVDRLIDKTKRPADTTETYKVVPTAPQTVSFYSLNYWKGRLEGNPTTTVDDFSQSGYSFSRPSFTGSFTGAWHPAIRYDFDPAALAVKETRSVGKNVVVTTRRVGLRRIQETKNTSFDNPPVAVTIVTFIKDSKRTQEVRTRISEDRYLSEILKGLNTNRAALEESLATTFRIQKRANNFIHSSCTQAVASAEGYQIEPYYDGISLYSSKPSGKITSYNKSWPGVKLRWIIYNGQAIHSATGANQVIEYQSIEEQKSRPALKLVPGSTYNYNASTNTVTYNSNIPCLIWAVAEENPAQYKQWQTETIYNVVNGQLIPQ